MSTFTVIMLAIVSYFIIGGFVMGLIDDSYHIMRYVWFWPIHVMAWLIELGIDLGEGVTDLLQVRRGRKHD